MLPDATGAAVPRLRGAEILARTAGLDAIAEVEAVDWGLVPASHLRFAQILEIGGSSRRCAARPDVDGVVVVQGTDVLEETAFAWDLLHASAKPVVVVGRDARRGGPGLGRAAQPARRGRGGGRSGRARPGVLVVMAGLVLPARDARKTHTRALDTFQAPDGGAIGRVVDGRVELAERGAGARPACRRSRGRGASRSPSSPRSSSTDGDLLRAAVERGARGIVVAATGAGNTDPDLLAAAGGDGRRRPGRARQRCGAGGVAPAYGFPGGGATWQAAGAIMGGTLSGPNGSRRARARPRRRPGRWDAATAHRAADVGR